MLVRPGFIGMTCGELELGNIIVASLRGNCLFPVVTDLNVDNSRLCHFLSWSDLAVFFIDCCDGMDVFWVSRDCSVCLTPTLLAGHLGFDENWGVVITWNEGTWCGPWCPGLRIFGFEMPSNSKLPWSCDGPGELMTASLVSFQGGTSARPAVWFCVFPWKTYQWQKIKYLLEILSLTCQKHNASNGLAYISVLTYTTVSTKAAPQNVLQLNW